MLNFLTLKPTAFGLDLSDFSLKIAQLKRKGAEFDLASFGEAEIPEGVIEGGEIKNEEALTRIVRQAVSRVRGKKIRTEEVIVSLPEEKAFLRLIQFPKMAKEELEKAVSFEAENHIPIPVKESCLGFEVVEPLVNHLDHFDLLLAAVPQKIVDPYVRALRAAGLKPCAMEIESSSTSRALIKNGLTTNPVLLIDFGATRTGLIVFSGRSIRFTSSLPISSSDLTRALASKLNLDFAAAEKVKINCGLEAKTKVRLEEKTGDSQLEKEILEDHQVSQILAPVLLQLVSEIKNFLDFYYSHTSHEHLSPSRHEIKRVLLSGGGSNLKGLDRHLARELGLPVVLGNPWINILDDPQERVPEAYLRRSLSYTNALGLALRGIMADYD
ncbi:MAG: type IV pilus assembly protein PilM [Candidatus Nealsonbacteria bacterium]|nr:type IV pilus assembly protein PilM [Candidatus Nealsonbacteria bacterium]